MPLSLLSNQTEFALNQIPQTLIAVFTIDPNTDFTNKVTAELDKRKAELEAKNITVLFATPNTATIDRSDFLLDTEKFFTQKVDTLKTKSQPGENLIIFKRDGDELTYLVHKESPEHEYEWITVVSDFADNYFNPNPNDQKLYKWGQIVPEAGDYLCVDCGYIATFEAGDIFPVCEVCLSGEPAGPTSSDGAFWEKV
jgi:hypothetical protein